MREVVRRREIQEKSQPETLKLPLTGNTENTRICVDVGLGRQDTGWELGAWVQPDWPGFFLISSAVYQLCDLGQGR